MRESLEEENLICCFRMRLMLVRSFPSHVLVVVVDALIVLGEAGTDGAGDGGGSHSSGSGKDIDQVRVMIEVVWTCG